MFYTKEQIAVIRFKRFLCGLGCAVLTFALVAVFGFILVYFS
jgi:hypothetical protein